MKSLIEIKNVSYCYPENRDNGALPAIRNISVKIAEGEFIALIGSNGSGKTTLARLINGLLLPSEGVVYIDGQDTREPLSRRVVHSQVGMVFQNPEDQIVATRVEDDVAFGLENMGLPSYEIRNRVDDVLRELDLYDQRDREPHLLSAGQMQRLALAGVLATRPRVIVFDEVTAMLDPLGRMTIMDEMEKLNAAGLTLIFITHSMEEAAHARRIIILHKGDLAMDGSPEQIFSRSAELTDLGLELPDAIRMSDRMLSILPGMIERSIRSETLLMNLPRYPGTNGYSAETEDEIHQTGVGHTRLISVEDLDHVYMQGTPLAHTALERVTMFVDDNASHGLAGSTGSGKSTLLQHLNGLLRPQGGKVQVGPYNMADPQLELKKICQFAALVMQNPEMQFFEQYVGDEIAFGPRQIGRKDIAAAVRSAMEMVGLNFDSFVNRYVYNLSGGERRKVALASILALNPQLLLLDEPFAGLDPASHSSIREIFHRVQSQGKTVLLSSHRMEDIVKLTTNMTILHKGKSLFTGSIQDVFYNTDLLKNTNILPPFVVQVISRMIDLGWPLRRNILTEDEFMHDLQRIMGRAG